MHDAKSQELLHSAAVLLLAVAAEDGNVDQREVSRAGETLAVWGRTDRVSAAQTVQHSFVELGEIWNMGGHAELDRHVWSHAGTLVEQLSWQDLDDLRKRMIEVADADGTLDRAEEGLVDALASFFDREAGPPEAMSAVELLESFDFESRGVRWAERFHARIAKTTVEVGDPNNPSLVNPRVIDGPAGFKLAEARLRSVGGLEVPFFELARWCTDEGVGLTIEPHWTDPPGHAFRLGELWSFRAFDGSFTGPPAFGREPYLDEVLPPWAREQMAHLFQLYGLPGRQVALLTSPAGEPTLAFDAPSHFMPDANLHQALEKALRFATPPGMVFLTVDPSRHPEFPFEPL